MHRSGFCWRCHLQGISWAFRGAHRNQASFHDETIGEVRREIERNPDAKHIGSGTL
jgi:hypothetical protein